MTIINGGNRRRQRGLNLDHVVVRIEMIDRDGANRTRCRLIEHEAVVPLADRYCVTTANCPMLAVELGSRNTKARVTCGAICLSNSAHLPLMLYSKFEKPVILPPGWAILSTEPAPTGSATFMNTIGIVRVACCSDAVDELPMLKITSGRSATSSAA